MLRAIELSALALKEAGTEPFGAVVVMDGRIVGEGINRSAARHDPTSHGEVEAIRDACRRLHRLDLAGAELYSSCEPCALCVAAMHIVGIRRLYFGASLGESDRMLSPLPAARRRPIDNTALRHAAGRTLPHGGLDAQQHGAAKALSIIAAWATAHVVAE